MKSVLPSSARAVTRGRRLALLIGLLRGDAADKLAAGHVRGDLIIEVGGGDQDICAAQDP